MIYFRVCNFRCKTINLYSSHSICPTMISSSQQDMSDSILKDKDEKIFLVEHQKEIELRKAKREIEEITLRVNTLAKQNGELRAKNEQQKVYFDGKERDFNKHVLKVENSLVQKEISSQQLKHQIAVVETSLSEKDCELQSVSKDLAEKTSLAEKLTERVNDKNSAFLESQAELSEYKTRCEQMDSSHQIQVNDLQMKLVSASEELERQSEEAEELHKENLCVNELLRESRREVSQLKANLQDSYVKHEITLQQAISVHNHQMEDSNQEREKLMKQLADSKQIIASTTTELHNNRVAAVEKEVEQRKESESQLLDKIKALSEEKRALVGQLTHSNAKVSAVESNFKQIQESLFEASAKSATLESKHAKAQELNNDLRSHNATLTIQLKHGESSIQELGSSYGRLESELVQSQNLNNDLRSHNESLTMQLKDGESEIQELTSSIERLESEHVHFQDLNNNLKQRIATSTMELKDGESKIQELTSSIERLESEQNQSQDLVTNSQALHLELSEVKRSAESKTNNLMREIEQQTIEFESEKMRFEEQLTDSRVFIRNLMMKVEAGSNESSEAHEQLVTKLELDINKLQMAKDHVQELFDACESERKALICDNERALRRIEVAEAETKRWMESSRVASNDISTLQHSTQEAESRANGLEETSDRINIECDALRNELKDLSSKTLAEKKSLETQLEAATEKLSSAQNALSNHRPDDGVLMRQIIELENKFREERSILDKQKQKFLHELALQNNHHDNVLNGVKRTFSESVLEKETFIEKLQTDIEEKQAVIETLAREKDDLSAKCESIQDLARLAGIDAAALEGEKEALKRQLQIMEESSTASKIENQDAIERELKAVEGLKVLEEKLELHRQRSSEILAETNDNNKKRIDEMQRAFSESVVEKEKFIEKLLEDLENKRDSVDTLAVDYRSATEQKEDLNLQLCEARGELKLIQGELEVSKRELCKQRDEKRSMERDYNSTTEQLQSTLKVSIAEKVALEQQLQKGIDDKQDYIDSSTEEHQRVMLENENLKAEISELNDKVLELNHNVESIQMEVVRSRDEFTSLKNKMEGKLIEVERGSHQDRENLQTELSLALKEKDDLITILRSELETLDTAKRRLQGIEVDISSSNKTLSLELEKSRQHMSLIMQENKETIESLQIELQSVSEELSRKENMMKQFKETNEQLEESNHAYLASIAGKDELVDQMHMEGKMKIAEVESLTKDKARALTNAENLSTQIVELNSHLSVNSDTAKKLQVTSHDLEEAKKTINLMKDSIASKSDKIIVMTDEINSVQRNYEKLNEEQKKNMEVMEENLKETKSSCIQRIADLENSHASERNELCQNLDVAHDNISLCREQLMALGGELAKKDRSIDALGQQLKSKEGEISSLVDKRDKEIANLKEFSASLEQQICDKRSKNEELSTEIKRLEKSLNDTKCEAANLKDQVRISETETATKHKSLRNLTTDLMNTCAELKLKNHGSAVKAEYSEDYASDLVRVLSEAVKDNQSNAMAGLELANSREKAVFRLERTLTAKERDIQGLQKDVSKLKSSLSQMKNQQYLMKSRSSELDLKIRLLENDKAEVENEHLLSEDLLNSMRKEKSDMQSKMDSLTEELEKSKSCLLRALTTVNEYEVKIMFLGQAQDQLGAQSTLIENLQSDFDNVSSEIESLVLENGSLENEVEALRSKLASSKSKELATHEKNIQLEMQSTKASSEFSESAAKNITLCNDNTSLLAKLESNQNTVDTLTKDLSALKNQISNERASHESHAYSQKRIATVLEKHLRSKSEESIRIRQTKDAAIGELRKKLEAKDLEMKNLTLDIERAEMKMQSISTEKENVEYFNTDISKQLEKKNASTVKILARSQGLEKELDMLMSTLKRKDDELQDVTSSLKELENKELEYKCESGDLLNKVQAKASEMEQLGIQIDSLTNELKSSKQTIEAYESKLVDQKKKSNSDFQEVKRKLDESVAKEAGYKSQYNDMLQNSEEKALEISQLKIQIDSLDDSLESSKKRVETYELQIVEQKEESEEKINDIEHAYQDTKARLFGAERLAVIHDKECTRLLNDIEDKSKQIGSLTDVVERLEIEQEEAKLKMNELQGSVSTQKEMIVALEDELRDRSGELQDIGSNNMHLASNIEDLHEQIRSLELKLEDNETEMEILACESKDNLDTVTELQEKLDSSEEEVQLLCESIEEKEGEIDVLNERLHKIEEEKEETISLLAELKDRAGFKDATNLDFVNDDDGISLGLSRTSMSPTASDIVQKHSELLDDLDKMKTAILLAISPTKKSEQEKTLSKDEDDSSIVTMLQEEVHEKNSVLEQMGAQIDLLMDDVSKAKKALNEKELSVEELTVSLKELEKDKADLKRKLKSRKVYIKQLEDALSHEVKHRRETDKHLNSVMEEKRVLVTENRTKSEELSLTKKRVEEKSNAVQEQMKVARQLARQLHTTKQKIFALKQHLQQEGLLKDGNLSSIPHHSPLLRTPNQEYQSAPDICAAASNDSLNWSVSEDDQSSSA